MTRVVICQDDARNTTGCGNGHLQDGEGEAIRSDCQARMATGHPNGMGRGNSKGKDRVKDCREHGSSGTGRDDLRGRHTPSPFLYMHTCNPVIWPHTSSSPFPEADTCHLSFECKQPSVHAPHYRWLPDAMLNRPYFPRHLKSLKLRSFRRCYEQAAALHGRIQTGRRQAGD